MRRKATPVHPYTRTPSSYVPGDFADARSEHGFGLEAQAGMMLLRYLHQMGGRYRLSVVAGMLAERYPFHKQPLEFFQQAAQELERQGRLVLKGDEVLSPVVKLSRDLQRRLVQAVVSEMVLTPKVNTILERLRQSASALIVLHPALPREQQQKIDRAASAFEGLLRDVQGKLGKLDAELQTLWRSVDPGRRRALEQTQKNLLRAFR